MQLMYDWAFVCLDDRASHPGGQAGQHWLLVRRNRTTGELAFYRCWTPRPVLLATLVRVAGLRWTIEERFQTGKGLVGLDQHQVRRWRTWYRWTTLATATTNKPGTHEDHDPRRVCRPTLPRNVTRAAGGG